MRYWRGQTLSAGFVAQPTVASTLGGFSANLWSNVDMDNDEEDDDRIVPLSAEENKVLPALTFTGHGRKLEPSR